MGRDLNKTRNERRMFFITPQRKDSVHEAAVTSVPFSSHLLGREANVPTLLSP